MGSRSVLYIDMAYRLAEVREKKHEKFFLARHASGFFRKVWSVHPMADLVGSGRGKIEVLRFASDHVVIEGKSELCRLPKFLLPVNFLFSQIAVFRVLVRAMKKNDIDLVMAADPFYSGLLGLAIARRSGKPLGIRIGGNTDEIYAATGALAMPRLIPSYWLQRAVQRFVLSRADLVSGINRNNLGFGIANGARRQTAVIPISSNISAVHSTAPADRAGGKSLLRDLGVKKNGPVIVYVGRLINLKHPDDALRVMAQVVQHHPSASGLFVGVGPMREELERLAEELGVRESIHFAGLLDQEALSAVIPHCITLSPSAGQLALLECALAGSPIVAYDRDYQPEFIEDGVNGFIVRFRDWRAMAEKVTWIIKDPALAVSLSKGARERALQAVDPDLVRKVEWEAFGRLMGEWSAPRAQPAAAEASQGRTS